MKALSRTRVAFSVCCLLGYAIRRCSCHVLHTVLLCFFGKPSLHCTGVLALSKDFCLKEICDLSIVMKISACVFGLYFHGPFSVLTPVCYRVDFTVHRKADPCGHLGSTVLWPCVCSNLLHLPGCFEDQIKTYMNVPDGYNDMLMG